MKKQKSIKINFIYFTSLKVLSIIFPLITFPYVARILSPEGIGKVDFSLSVIQYFILIAQVGIPTYAIRECAKHRDDKEKLAKTVQEIFIINLIMVVISYILFAFSIVFIDKLNLYRDLLLIVCINILSTSIGIEWFYQAIEEYKFITIRSVIIKLLSIILIFTLIKTENDYIIYAFITVLSISIEGVFNFFVLNKHIKIFKNYKNYNLIRHIKPILMLFAISISVSIYVNLNKVMLGFISGEFSVGLYTAVNKMIVVIITLVTSLGSVMLPRMSYYIEKNELVEIKRLNGKSFDFTLMISVPATVGMFMLAKPILLMYAGKEYIDAVSTIQITSPTIILIALSNLIGIQILVAHGKEKITLFSTMAGAVTNFLLNLCLIGTLEQDGAAIGTLVAETIVTLIQFIFAISYLKNTIKFKNIITYIFGSGLIIIIIMSVGFYVENIYFSTLISAVLSIFAYFGFLFFVKNELVYETANRYLIARFKR